ncbi:MAG TPA: GWxTD domain-containing protein [Candidatus Polarisedimenticolia bacterium]|jgi:GWxTD domain-containing protein
MTGPRALLSSALAATVVLLAGVTALPAARKKIDYVDKPTTQWREGPVRYIITKWEDNEYKDLRTQEERARFIEEFWRRRDETPDTPGNEYRAEFWKRVRDANRLYSDDTSTTGWRTDMGKIHILRGPPDEITRDLVAQGNRGTVIWTYRNAGAPGIGPNVVVAFARDISGEFRLSTQPSKDSDPRIGGAAGYQPPMGTTAMARSQTLILQERAERAFNLTDPLIRQAGGAASAPPLALLTELTRLQQPRKEWEVRESITTHEFFGAVPIRARAEFFRTTTSKSLVVVTAGVRSTGVHYRRLGGREVPDVVLYGRVLDLTGNDLVASLEKDSDFAPAAENAAAGIDDDLLFQARVPLSPGSYKILLTAVDRVSGRAGSYQVPLTVPDLGATGLTLSSLMLARAISPDATASPYVIGSLRVLPRLSQTFAPGDELAFYYQVYGAAKDAATALPSLDVDYGFYTVEAEKTYDVGHVSFSSQTSEAHGYSLALKDWPPGPYLLRVLVTDRIAGTSASRDLVFEVR